MINERVVSDISDGEGRKRVLHIITGLKTGGAEMMLLKLVTNDGFRREYDSLVLALLPGGPIQEKLNQHGIPVLNLEWKGGKGRVRSLHSILKDIRQFRPNLIQGWMYHGNFVASLLRAGVFRGVPIVWNLRCSNPTPAKGVTAFIRRALVSMSRRVDVVLANSQEGIRYHVGIGYDDTRMRLIPNGVSLEKFARDSEKRKVFRKRHGIPENRFVIGKLASWRPMKDYRNFIEAAKYAAGECQDILFVIAGRGVDASNQELVQLVENAGLIGRVKMLGETDNVVGFMNGIDLFCLASREGEGFPNVLAEAMACERICVTTDVGDSALVVGDTGKVVPTSAPDVMARSWIDVIKMDPKDRKKLEIKARERIEANYHINVIARQYALLYKQLIRFE